MTKQIKKEISKRRQINKKRRKEKDPTVKQNLKAEYHIQKEKVQIMVQEEIENFEIKITNKILNDKNRSRKIWKHIHMLINRNTEEEAIRLYSETGIIPRQQESMIIRDFWQNIYQRHENRIEEEYSKEEYKQQFERLEQNTARFVNHIDLSTGNLEYVYEEMEIPPAVAEHLDMICIQVTRNKPKMKMPKITAEKVREQLKRKKMARCPYQTTYNQNYTSI